MPTLVTKQPLNGRLHGCVLTYVSCVAVYVQQSFCKLQLDVGGVLSCSALPLTDDHYKAAAWVAVA